MAQILLLLSQLVLNALHLLLVLLSPMCICVWVFCMSLFAQGKLRVTIQGETIEQQFGEREVCFR
jgi:hypothetical protein